MRNEVLIDPLYAVSARYRQLGRRIFHILDTDLKMPGSRFAVQGHYSRKKAETEKYNGKADFHTSSFFVGRVEGAEAEALLLLPL
jgi:hypothetical protein